MIRIGANLSRNLNAEFKLGGMRYWYAVPGIMTPHRMGGTWYPHIEAGVDWLIDRHPELMAQILNGDKVLDIRSPFAAGDNHASRIELNFGAPLLSRG